MILLIIVLILVLVIAYFHYTQGFFSATLSAFLVIISAVFAFSFDETLLEKLLAGKFANYAHGMMMLLLFMGSYSILRQIFDSAVPGQMRLPLLADRIGAAVMGIVAGVFATGIIMIAAQEFPFGPSFIGYSRYTLNDDHDVNMNMPNHQQGKTYHVYDELKSDEPGSFGDDSSKHTLFVDDLVVNTVGYLSNGGSLEGDQPLTTIHPDFLTELFGQRIGIEPGARNVAMNIPAKNIQDVKVAGLYSLPSVAQAESEVPKLRTAFTAKVGQILKVPPDSVLLVVRTVFSHTAMDSDALTRVSAGAVHLVTQAPKGDGSYAYTDYYPLGTMQGDATLFLNKLDDPLFLDGHQDQAADFVFMVKKDGFVDGAKMKVLPGTFLDVKRMARVDLSDQTVKSEFVSSPLVAVARKTLAMPDGGMVTIASLSPPPAPAPTAPAPASVTPEPSAPAPAPAPAPSAPNPPPRDTGIHSPQAAADNGVFDVIGATASSSLSIPISCGADPNAKQITLPGGDAILKNGKFLSLNLDVQETQATLSTGPGPVKDLLAKDGEGLVIVSGTAPHGGWDWASKADQIAVVDSAGKQYPANGVWADVDQAGQKKFFARYSENYPLDALTPGTGTVGNVWFSFSIPAGTEVKQLVLGARQIGEFSPVKAEGQ